VRVRPEKAPWIFLRGQMLLLEEPQGSPIKSLVFRCGLDQQDNEPVWGRHRRLGAASSVRKVQFGSSHITATSSQFQ
jgi:hypothetical protein